MRERIRILLLVGVTLLMIPLNPAAAAPRRFSTGFLQRVVPAIIYSSENPTVSLEASGEAVANTDSETNTEDNSVAAANSDEKENASAKDGAIKNTTKTADVLKNTNPVKSSINNTPVPVKKQPDGAELRHLTSTSGKNKLQLENILLYISSWWLHNPLNLQVWYLFCLAGLVLYLFKLNDYRRPLLFCSTIILGFYLGSSLDPISAVFTMVPKTNFTFDAAISILGFAVIVSLFIGRLYCGWLCPLGAIQELIHPGTKTIIPSALDTLLKYLKYLILLIFLYLTWRSGNDLWSQYEPLKVLVHFNGSELALFLLVITLAVSVLIERPFCRYICPLGAILAITSRLALFKMRADSSDCMVCGKCTTGECPMNAIESNNTITDLPVINNAECIYCMRCQKICQRSAIRISARHIDKMLNT